MLYSLTHTPVPLYFFINQVSKRKKLKLGKIKSKINLIVPVGMMKPDGT